MAHNNHFQRTNGRRNFIESAVIGAVLTGLSYIIGLLAGWISLSALNWLEVFAVFTAYSSVYLSVRERRLNYPVGAISSAAYAVLFLQSGLISSAILNAYMVPALVYGWIRWRTDSNTRPITHVALKWVPAYVGITVAGYLGATFFSQSFGGSLAWTDSVILAGTILAQFLMDNKKLENWVIWGIVNIFAIYTYASTGLPLVAVQYVLFLLNTGYGFIEWKRSKDHGESIRVDDSYATDNRSLAVDSVR